MPYSNRNNLATSLIWMSFLHRRGEEAVTVPQGLLWVAFQWSSTDSHFLPSCPLLYSHQSGLRDVSWWVHQLSAPDEMPRTCKHQYSHAVLTESYLCPHLLDHQHRQGGWACTPCPYFTFFLPGKQSCAAPGNTKLFTSPPPASPCHIQW